MYDKSKLKLLSYPRLPIDSKPYLFSISFYLISSNKNILFGENKIINKDKKISP